MKENSNKKYVVLVGDGMADYPLDELQGKTPLESAKTPHMDRIAACHLGLAKTIPDDMEAGSDVANLSLLGYDPRKYHTGRAPLEAASMDVEMSPEQIAFRMNLVTLDHRSKDEIIMVSHSSGDISTEESAQIVASLRHDMQTPDIEIHSGVAYRHLLLWRNGVEKAHTIPPHDVLDQNMAPYLAQADENPVPVLIRDSWSLLKDHPANIKRKGAGLKEANSIWLWGQGKAPRLPLFNERYGLEGGVISAVDLLKGIGIYAGFRPIPVIGATGYLDTNYYGKAEGAIKGLEELDFIFLHVEAPDEAGHNGNIEEKILAIEYFDEKVVGTVLKGMRQMDDYRIMVVSDHFTPISLRTHTREPAPFAWASKKELESGRPGAPFTEGAALKSGVLFAEGHNLMDAFLKSP
ncbi:cofactor-independent phosphoglycerate mutase [Thermodesulfobacteriota bacterium]